MTKERVPLKKNLATEDRKNELAMMNQKYVGGWPNWPFLPVKRSMTIGGPECGVLIDTGPLHQGVRVEPIIHDYLDTRKVLAKYQTLEELVDDGWVVD